MAKKTLRFAALIRVSTEQQEKTGESLRTQTSQIEAAVERLGGKITKFYGGQEHATPGYEKAELESLLDDASKGKFDAVIVAHVDRWSRDNTKSKQGLEIFKKHGIAFYVDTKEFDLFNPTEMFFLGMSAEIGQLQASTQNKKSIESRIHRAKRGIPTSGKKPYARTFDKEKGEWVVDKEKKKQIREIAKRYLAGESMAELAAEFEMNHSNLNKILRRRCGTTWHETFKSTEFNIDEVVEHEIPALLPESTIRRIAERAEFNRTYTGKGKQKLPYLLSSHLFCEHCGYSVFAQTNHGIRCYRHCPKSRQRARPCPCKRHTFIRAEEIEENVMYLIFEAFGNPKALQQAIEDATPDSDKKKRLWEKYRKLEKDLAKLEKSRDRLIDLHISEKITQAVSDRKFAALSEKEESLSEMMQLLNNQIAYGKSPEEVKQLIVDVSRHFEKPRISDARNVAARRQAKLNYYAMSYEDKRELLKDLFAGKTTDGKPMGVYVRWTQKGVEKPTWSFRIEGAIDSKWRRPKPLDWIEEVHEERSGESRAVTESACH